MVTRGPTGRETAQYTAPKAGFALDVFGAASPSQYAPSQPGLGAARYKLYKTADPTVVGFRVELFDGRQGLNHTKARYDESPAGFASSTLDTRFKDTLVLPQKISTAAVTTSGSTNLVTPWANAFNTMLIAAGNRIFKETSTTDPTLTEIAITANTLVSLTNIVSASTLYIGDVTTPRAVFGRLDGPAAIITDPDNAFGFATWGTTTFPFWGAVQTPVNNNAIISYIGTTFCSTQSDQSVNYNSDPTVERTDVKSGGYALGMKSLGGRPLRLYWVLPDDNSAASTGAMAFGRTSRPRMRIYSTNLEAGELQELTGLTLKTVAQAMDYREGYLVHDGDRVVYHGGRVIRDTRIFSDVPANSDRDLKVRQLFANGPEALALCIEKSSALGVGNTRYSIRAYDYDLDTWHQISSWVTLDSTGDQIVLAPGGGAISDQTGFMHYLTKNSGQFHRMYVPPYGTNTFGLRKTDGATDGTGREYEAEGTVSFCFQLPGLEGQPKIVSRIICMADLDSGGADAYETVVAGGKTATFRAGRGGRHQVSEFHRNNDFFYDLDVSITLGRTTSGTDATRYTPNGFPVAIEGFCKLDDLTMPLNTNWDNRR